MYKTHLIAPPRPQDDRVSYPDGNTQDIINTVLFADKIASKYTEKFAATLRGATGRETCRNIWEFVKTQIPYKLDPSGVQWIKSPGRLWADKAGDCKSFSVFTASCLKNLNLPYGYRFTSYRNDPTPTHVYVFVPLGKNKEIILDSVWDGPFDTQKEYTHKKDYLMSEISYLGSIGGRVSPQAPAQPAHTPGELRLTKPVDQITEGEMDLLLARQRLEIEKANSIGIAGPNNYQVKRYDAALATINAAIASINNPDAICGMGENMVANARARGQKEMVGNIFKKIGKGIKKGVKAVTKVITLPIRMIAKGILEIYLPKAAPAFLYLFAEEKVLADKMKAKRKKSLKFKNFVVKKIGMKDKHFMSIVRNSLTKKYKMSPENYLAKALKNVAVKGIGSTKQQAWARVNQQRIGSPFIMPNLNLNLQNVNKAAFKKQSRQQAVKAATNIATNMASGNPVGAIIAAIEWIISKLGGKKEGVELGANDMPDVYADSGNATNFDRLNQDYGDLNNTQQDSIREGMTDMINRGYTRSQAYNTMRNDYPYLNDGQRQELSEEVEEGFNPMGEQDLNQMARRIKQGVQDPTGEDIEKFEQTGGGTGPGLCKC